MKRLALGLAGISLLGLFLLFPRGSSRPGEPPRLLKKAPPAGCRWAGAVPSPRERAKSEQAMGPTDEEIVALAERHLAEQGVLARVAKHHRLVPTVVRTPLRSVVAYAIEERGLPIVGMNVWVRMDKRGNLVELFDEYRPLPPSDLSAIDRVSAADVAERLDGRFEARGGTDDSSPILFVTPNAERAEVAFVLSVRDVARGGPAPVQAVFRASDSQILGRNLPRAEFEPPKGLASRAPVDFRN